MTPQHSDAPSATLASATPETRTMDDSFDIREFARTARGNHRAELDLSGVHELPLDAVRLTRTLRDLERTTMHRMRNVLVTATHKDARVTAFLTTWAFEKFWLADALDAVLDAAEEERAATEFTAPPRTTLSERVERRGPVKRAIAANIAGPALVDAHITTQLVDEWIGQIAYRKLGELAAALGSVVEMVLDVKSRHIAFFAEEAQRRLASSRKGRRLTRRELSRMAWPVGATELAGDERDAFERIVFGGGEGQAAVNRIGALIASLPGMQPVAPVVAARLAP
ncbi:hypothetical protein [Pseudolysinimonas sp.]|uniref:hypothetical protein n=1 Tax=Pseudolysinimonas sp. TaxID=2680009 RepID=UPI003F7E4313